MSWTVPDCPAGSVATERKPSRTDLAPLPSERVLLRRKDSGGIGGRGRYKESKFWRSSLVMGLFAALTIVSCISSPTGPESMQDSLDEPGRVSDLIVTNRTSTSATISFTQVENGYGQAADYVARVQRGPINWGLADEVVEGSCAAPLKGTAPGERVNCTVNGLESEPGYQFQVAAFRGTFQNGAVYGELSNVASDYSGPGQGPIPSGARPNEPAGLVGFAKHPFTCLPGENCGALGEWSRRENSNLTITDDANVPSGSVVRLKFPSGGHDGSSYARFDGWGPGIDENGTHQVDELYISFWLKIEGSGFENQSVGTKVFYIAYGRNSQANDAFLMLHNGTGSRTVQSSMSVYFYPFEGVTQTPHTPNKNNERIEVGSWHHVEAYFRINDINPTQGNGLLKIWIDGVPTHDYSDLRYRDDDAPNAFYHMQFTPVWGGYSGDTRTRDDYWRVADMYLSGR